MNRCTAVVVTCDRPNIFKQCIQGIEMQDKDLTRYSLSLVVVDNSHNKENCKANESILNDSNIKNYNVIHNDDKTASNGFFTGILAAINNDYGNNENLIWIMDDDTIPTKHSLIRLINTFNKQKCAFVSSFVKYQNKNEPFYKNIPRDAYSNEDLFDYMEKDVIKPINFGTFTSLLTSQRNIKNAGLPQKEFLIWGDDTEFSERLIYSNENAKGLLVCNSIVKHLTRQNDKTVWQLYPITEKRFNRFYYGFRNRIVASKRRGGQESAKQTIRREINEIIDSIIRVEQSDLSNEQKVEVIQKIQKYAEEGLIAGIFWEPRIHNI